MVDFHVHTSLCGHATGTADQYIITAIDRGIQYLGFSDHAPLPKKLRDGITMRPDQTEAYLQLVAEKRAAYRDRINIKTGFEVDFPLRETFDVTYLSDPRIDFLLGSCHYLDDWPCDRTSSIPVYEEKGADAIYTLYFDCVLAMIESAYFNIVAHLDLVKKYGYRPDGDFTAIITRIAKAIAKNKMAVELNTSGLRKPVKEIYPSEAILTILYEHDVAVTLGSDSHAPEEVGSGFDQAFSLLHKVGYRKIVAFSQRKRFEIIL
jgi:histidinol-phosphatase (PHP family)